MSKEQGAKRHYTVSWAFYWDFTQAFTLHDFRAQNFFLVNDGLGASSADTPKVVSEGSMGIPFSWVLGRPKNFFEPRNPKSHSQPSVHWKIGIKY